MDRDIAALYDDAGVHGFRLRFSPALIQLARHGPMTIRALADAVDVTHSAMSQTDLRPTLLTKSSDMARES
jgi:hypothetical protein